MRGVFSTGVLDEFLRRQFNPFDLYVGVSAGAGNLAAFLAEMPGRNLRLYCDYSQRRQFKSVRRFLTGGHLLDLDWLWRTTIAEIRLDLATIYAKSKPLIVCMTDVAQGTPVYRETSAADLEHMLKASSALPLLYRGFVEVDGQPMADGGLTDAIPVEEAVRRGAETIMVVRSRTADYVKEQGLADRMATWKLRQYPGLVAALRSRAKNYNAAIRFLRTPPPGVRVLEVCPPPTFRPSRLSRNVMSLLSGYRQGRRAGQEAIRAWQQMVDGEKFAEIE